MDFIVVVSAVQQLLSVSEQQEKDEESQKMNTASSKVNREETGGEMWDLNAPRGKQLHKRAANFKINQRFILAK